MRLLCQNIAQRANCEDGEVGKFLKSRFRAVRVLDDESLLACAAYVDLNPRAKRLYVGAAAHPVASAVERWQLAADWRGVSGLFPGTAGD
jgi:hypothetical protein